MVFGNLTFFFIKVDFDTCSTISQTDGTTFFYGASNDGTAQDSGERVCTTPLAYDAKILVPVLNGLYWGKDCCEATSSSNITAKDPLCTCSYNQMQTHTSGVIDSIPDAGSSYQVVLDGKPLPYFRLATDSACLFTTPSASTTIYTPPGTYDNAAGDGYWALIDASKLKAGQHKVWIDVDVPVWGLRIKLRKKEIVCLFVFVVLNWWIKQKRVNYTFTIAAAPSACASIYQDCSLLPCCDSASTRCARHASSGCGSGVVEEHYYCISR